MRKAMLVVGALAALMLSGCSVASSVYPLYEEKEPAAALPLDGNWADESGETLFRIRGAGSEFEVQQVEEKDVTKYHVHLTRLGDSWFADITLASAPDLTLPLHVFAKLWFQGPELRLQLLGSDWLNRQIAQSGLPVVPVGKAVALAAPTPALRQFVQKMANEPRAFDDEAARLRRFD